MLRSAAFVFPVLLAGFVRPAGAAEDDWVEPMRQVHARFTGQAGTCAWFGDSITVSLAFWAPLEHTRKNATEEMEAAFDRVKQHMAAECWRTGRGPEFGNEGGKTAGWAREHAGEWLKRLNPEIAIVMFGTNDVGQDDAGDHEANLAAVIEKCLAHGTVVVLTTIPPRHGFDDKVEQFVAIQRKLAERYHLPLVDYYAEILKRRPDDWDGALPQFSQYEGYDVPTLLARDGVHPSNPREFANDYSEEGLSRAGYTLRNYVTLMKYAEVIDQVLDPK